MVTRENDLAVCYLWPNLAIFSTTFRHSSENWNSGGIPKVVALDSRQKPAGMTKSNFGKHQSLNLK
jgi:hypothetical protein